MNTSVILSERRLISVLLLLGCLFGFAGILMFTNRQFLGGRFFPVSTLWERSLIGAAALIILLGFVLFVPALRASGEHLFTWIGVGALVLGTAITLLAEWQIITAWAGAPGRDRVLMWWAFVVLIFIGQAAYGVAFLRTGLLTDWLGWLMVIWNLAWLPILALFSRNDPYYPVLFYTSPLVLGIFLLRS